MSTAPVSGSVPYARGSNGAVLVNDNAAAESMSLLVQKMDKHSDRTKNRRQRQNEEHATTRDDNSLIQIKRNRTAAEQH